MVRWWASLAGEQRHRSRCIQPRSIAVLGPGPTGSYCAGSRSADRRDCLSGSKRHARLPRSRSCGRTRRHGGGGRRNGAPGVERGVSTRHAVWNPYAALVPFAATLVVAWAVAAGRVGWWPCLVGLASFCMQAHLMYVPAAGTLLLVRRWLASWRHDVLTARSGGVGQRLGRWLRRCVGPLPLAAADSSPGEHFAPAELHARSGRSEVGAYRRSAESEPGSVPPQPLWLRAPAKADLLETGGISPRWAIGAIVCLAAAVVIGWRRKRHDVTAVALVALVADLSAVAVIGGIPARSGLTIVYIQYVLWPVGAMTWFALGYSLAPALQGPYRVCF